MQNNLLLHGSIGGHCPSDWHTMIPPPVQHGAQSIARAWPGLHCPVPEINICRLSSNRQQKHTTNTNP